MRMQVRKIHTHRKKSSRLQVGNKIIIENETLKILHMKIDAHRQNFMLNNRAIGIDVY